MDGNFERCMEEEEEVVRGGKGLKWKLWNETFGETKKEKNFQLE